jgi:hypothetical protein
MTTFSFGLGLLVLVLVAQRLLAAQEKEEKKSYEAREEEEKKKDYLELALDEAYNMHRSNNIPLLAAFTSSCATARDLHLNLRREREFGGVKKVNNGKSRG